MVFCIDGTLNMAHCIDSVKENVKKFHQEFLKCMMDKGSEIDTQRIRIIVFRDYKSDGNNAMLVSLFYELPMDEDEFDICLQNISATGGCNEGANGLEALYFAMKSDFNTGNTDRQVIVLFTISDALKLGARSNEAAYPRTWLMKKGFVTCGLV